MYRKTVDDAWYDSNIVLLQDGQSALFHVIVKGQKRADLVERMLEQGANPNIQDAVSMIDSRYSDT